MSATTARHNLQYLYVTLSIVIIWIINVKSSSVILCLPIAKPHLREASTIQTKKGGLYINPEGLIYIAFLVMYYSIHYHYASKRCGVSVIKRKRKEETLTKQKPHNKYYH